MKKQYVIRNGVLRTLKNGVKLSDYLAKCAEKGYKVLVVVGVPPSITTMEKWMNTGIAKATDGCKVEPDGTCPHGHQSWLLVKGLI